MCFGTTTATATHTEVAPGFQVTEGCGGFYLEKVETKRNTIAWFETKQEAIDASHKG